MDDKNKKTHDAHINLNRRQFLTKATTAASAVGLAAACFPFAASMFPSMKKVTTKETVKVDLSDMKPGDQKTIQWQDKPVWIVRRTQKDLANLKKLNNLLQDPLSKVNQQPKYADNLFRSIKPEWLVVVGLCTHLGCVPTYRPEPGTVSKKWEGGFFCTCHGSKFDLSGRVYKGMPAPTNLVVPPYKFINDATILIGRSK